MEAVLRTPNRLLQEKGYTQESFWKLLEDFLEEKLGKDITILYRIDEEDLPEEVKKAYKDINNFEFIDY
jgi:hypothetical protein